MARETLGGKTVWEGAGKMGRASWSDGCDGEGTEEEEAGPKPRSLGSLLYHPGQEGGDRGRRKVVDWGA